jgi:hypothetical protein
MQKELITQTAFCDHLLKQIRVYHFRANFVIMISTSKCQAASQTYVVNSQCMIYLGSYLGPLSSLVSTSRDWSSPMQHMGKHRQESCVSQPLVCHPIQGFMELRIKKVFESEQCQRARWYHRGPSRRHSPLLTLTLPRMRPSESNCVLWPRLSASAWLMVENMCRATNQVLARLHARRPLVLGSIPL